MLDSVVWCFDLFVGVFGLTRWYWFALVDFGFAVFVYWLGSFGALFGWLVLGAFAFVGLVYCLAIVFV